MKVVEIRTIVAVDDSVNVEHLNIMANRAFESVDVKYVSIVRIRENITPTDLLQGTWLRETTE